jgi:hypothetical protein
MRPSAIRDVRDKAPFQPFELHLADGRAVPVVTPHHIMISPRNDEFAVYLPDGTLEVVDGKLVTSITRRPRRK